MAGTVTAAHIHRGPAGVAGPVVIPLFTDQAFAGTGADGGCVSAARSLIIEILDDPSAFYVNVHSTVYPKGAARGQLSPADDGGPG